MLPFLVSIPMIVLGLITLVLSLNDSDLIVIFVSIFLIGLGALILIGTIISNDQKSDFLARVERVRNKLLLDKGLESANWVSDMNSNLYVVDEASEKVKFFYSNNAFENFDYSVSEEYDFRDILESEVLIDGETISKTSRGSQIGGALLGGVLAGGVGAIIGGLSSPTKTKDTVSSIQLKLTVKNIKEPIRQIKLFQSEIPLRKDHETVKFYEGIATEWHGIFKVIINKADKIDRSVENSFNKENREERSETRYRIDKPPKDSMIIELRGLYELLQDGIITQEEFDSQKQKMLLK